MLSSPAPRQAAPMLAGRATWLRPSVRPDAFGNALGESIAHADWGGGSQQQEGLGARYRDGDVGASELRMGAPYRTDAASTEAFAGVFGDGYGSPVDRSTDVLLAAGQGYKLGEVPAAPWNKEGEILFDTNGRRYIVQDGIQRLYGELDRVEVTGSRLASTPTQPASIERSLSGIESLAQAYRDSGMVGSTGDAQGFDEPRYLGVDGRLYDTPQPAIPIVGRRMTPEEIIAADAAEYGSASPIEPSLWERTWLNPSTQQMMAAVPFGTLSSAAMNIAGSAVAGFRSDGYNFANGRHLNPVQRRDSRIDTVINLATLPLGMGSSTAIRAGSIVPKGPGALPQILEASAARHSSWAGDLGAIGESINRLGQRALRQAGNNPQRSEQLFEGYLSGVGGRLARGGSEFGIEIQPASLANAERVPNFIFMHRGGPSSPLIAGADGTPRLFAYPGSRRLDAGVTNTLATANEHGLQPVVMGFDITLNATKPNIVPYYQKYFGNIPIYDIRLPR